MAELPDGKRNTYKTRKNRNENELIEVKSVAGIFVKPNYNQRNKNDK
ncbi:MAG: hypothetical protein HUU44_14245 [Ignavibacteriaceae bacterium]|nr:hypothetical protein [Ignavibacteriaceae bacterium]